MRFLKRQTINRRQLKSTTVYSDVDDANVYVNPRNSGSLVLPSGTDAQIPASPVNGMMRYNVDHSEVQVYQSGTWRSLRFKEATQINREDYTGDGATSVFGPLTYQPPTTVESGATWSGNNLIVIVGNVFQVHTTNYLIQTGNTIGAPYNTGPNATKYYIKFTSSVPGLSTPVVVLHGFDQ
jgi:hypothetical protein